MLFVPIGTVHWGERAYPYALCPNWYSTLGRKSIPLCSLSQLVQYTGEKEHTPMLFVPIGTVHWGERAYLYALCPNWYSTLGRKSIPLCSLSQLVQYTGEKEHTPMLFVPIGTVHWGERAYLYALCPNWYSTLGRKSIPLCTLSPLVQYTGEKEHTPMLFVPIGTCTV